MAVGVEDHLDLDVPTFRQRPLDQQPSVAEGRLRLAPSAGHSGLDTVGRIVLRCESGAYRARRRPLPL